MQESDGFGVWRVELKQENGEMKKKACRFCGKEFSSGKALGGHVRSHVTKSKNIQESSVVKCSSTSTECPSCGKNFPSKKSLFGHMRCHPDRQWRGINPPTTPIHNTINALSSSLSSSSSSSYSSVSDLSESLIRAWPVTAKRGRKAATAASSYDEIQAAKFLVSLTMGRRKDYGEVDEGDKVKLLLKRKRKKVKLCDLNSMENDVNNNNIPVCGKFLDFDLNEIPES